MTVTVDATGRYHASFVVDVPDQPLPPIGARGRDRPGPDALRGAVRRPEGRQPADRPQGRRASCARAQQELARRQKGRRNRAQLAPEGRALPCPGRGHPPGLAAQAVDHADPREPSWSYVEDLAVSGLARTRLARSVARRRLVDVRRRCSTYKAQRHGRTFARVDRWFPSTRACSACGAIGEAKPLHVREWTCPCGAVHDRDVNAASNILAADARTAQRSWSWCQPGPRSRNRP